MTPITRDNVEELLDQGLLYALMNTGRWWQIRRNGKTRRWKRSPNRFEIPTKAGLKACGTIDNEGLGKDYFRHVDDVPKELRP